ncbi:MAG: ATP-binding cassette domain-containing protein [Desulfobacteraceae bacterium]
MAEPYIQITDLHKRFNSNHVMKGVNLSIYKNEITAIIGRSGCGKSVLLKHIIGLLEQDAGRIMVAGKDISGLTGKERKGFMRNLSYMFQNNALFDFLNIYDNISLPLVEGSSLSKRDIEEKVKLRMEQLEIEGIDNNYPAELSGGMRKRVALARALVTDPEVVLFDEPTTGLDPIRKNSIHKMIKGYKEKFGFTAVIVSHDIPDIFEITQRIAMLDDGKIIYEGDCKGIMNSENPVIQSFIQGRGTE